MKNFWSILLISLFLVSCAARPEQPDVTPEVKTDSPRPASPYPDLGLAPELTGDAWLNVDAPLSLAGLRGKVILLDMWTFG